VRFRHHRRDDSVGRILSGKKREIYGTGWCLSVDLRHFLASRYDPRAPAAETSRRRDSLIYIMLSALTLFLTKTACVRAFAKIPGALSAFSVGHGGPHRTARSLAHARA
jgi:hypothetical protein